VFAFMGDRSLFDTCFAGLPPDQARRRPFGPHEAYLDFVLTWDAGLAPLARGGFADARTDTKFATYAACGVAALLERHPVYEPHSARALLFDGADDLAAKLEWLLADRRRATDLARRGWLWAKRERSAAPLAAQRVGFYETLIENTRPREEAADGVSPLDALRRNHRASDRRVDYLRRLLEEQPYDYVALRTIIAHGEAHPEEGDDLALLYHRLCLLAPEAVPELRRPPGIRRFLPA
jgi:hypothetical protein